jgi:sirohydrochlorin ferrochelatase
MPSNNSKKAVILMGHGSRVPGAGSSMEMVAQRLRETGQSDIVETCYMSRLGPAFPDVLARCVDLGAEEVVLIPYFLNMGLHIRVDIPAMLRREAEKYTGLKIIFGKNIGYDDLLVELVRKRIDESSEFMDVRELEIEDESYELPPGEKEFVAMTPEEAKDFRKNRRHAGEPHEH